MVEFKGKFKVIKISPGEEEFIMCARVSLVDGGGLVCTNIEPSHSDLEYAWYRTSKVDRVLPLQDGYKVYTQNSVYRLKKLK